MDHAVACHVGDDPLAAWADSDVYRMPTTEGIQAMLDEASFARTNVVSNADDGE